MSPKTQGYKTVKDFMRIVSLFNDFKVEALSITEISKALNMDLSKVSRMLGTLNGEGFFERDPNDGKYRLGAEFFTLGMIYFSNIALRKIIRPHIEQVAKELNLTSNWAILRNCRVIVMDRIQNLNIDLISHRIGLNLPIYSSSLGKVLLAYLPEDEQDRILQSVELKPFTPKTVVDPKLIKENLKLVVQSGCATDEGETHEHLNCIAAPIRNNKGEVIAAINITGETSRILAEQFFEYTDYLKEKALFISRQLGFGAHL